MNRTLPFNSLLEYTLFFLELKKNIPELKKFASEKSINGIDFDYFDYSTIVTIFYTHDTISLNDNTWLLFSDSDLDVLLEDEFFSEYMRTLKVNFSYTTRKYPFLEVYIYYKLHSIATDYLSYDETNLMAGNWLCDSEFICDKEKYQMTHDCLIKRNSCYPSIGSIPFNGIVHGNMELTAEIDKQCYSDITAMLYNPPVRILFEIIENSMRGELR